MTRCLTVQIRAMPKNTVLADQIRRYQIRRYREMVTATLQPYDALYMTDHGVYGIATRGGGNVWVALLLSLWWRR